MVALALLSLLAAPVQARSGYDQNFPDVNWYSFETEHFVVHWPESNRPKDDPHWFTTAFTAGRIAMVGEDVWPRVTAWYDYPAEEKIHMVVLDLDRGWEGNGFALAEWDWIAIAADWASVYRQRGRMEWATDVLPHEFAHIISLKTIQPFSEGTTGLQLGGLAEDEEWLQRWGRTQKPNINADLGADLLVTASTPVWWVEGTAEYTSHVSGYNFWGTAREAFLRTTFLENRQLGPDEWVTMADKHGFEPERCYNQGYNFGLYLRERLGETTYPDIGKAASESWLYNWNRVVQEVTGFTTKQLWTDWNADRKAKFQATADAVRAAGEVTGREMALVEPAWEKNDADWQKLSKKQQNEAMDGKTPYQELPSWSPDGNYYAWFNKGLNVRRAWPEEYGAISGTYVDKKDNKKIKEYDRRTTTEDFLEYYRVGWAPDSRHLVATGPEDLPPRFLRDNGLFFNADGYNWTELKIGTIEDESATKKHGKLKIEWAAIPGTLRAREAAWSPDGNTIVYSRYSDGNHELWAVTPDGRDNRQLTHFGDGAQIQGISFTPDGRQVVSAIFRQYRQDLFLVDVATGELTRLTDTKVDESDPFFGPDGKVWFSSDLDGIYNVYSLDLSNHEVRRQTNLVGGSYAPNVAPTGDLFYTAVTGHGFRIHGLPASKLRQEVVAYPGLCGVDPQACQQPINTVGPRPGPDLRTPGAVAPVMPPPATGDAAPVPAPVPGLMKMILAETQTAVPSIQDLPKATATPTEAPPAEALPPTPPPEPPLPESPAPAALPPPAAGWNLDPFKYPSIGTPITELAFDAKATSTPYKASKALFPLSGWPVARYTDKNVEVGSQFYLGDYSEAHWLQGEATFGKDNYISLMYWLDTLWPSIMVGWMRYSYKGTYGYGVDEDGVPETTDDVRVVDLKFEQQYNDVWTYVTYSPSFALWGGIGADWTRYAFRETADGPDWKPYTDQSYLGFFVEWDPRGAASYDGDQYINPRGGRRMNFNYEYHRTALADADMSGGVYDDGELFTNYGYNKIYGGWTEFVPLTWFGLTKHHTLQLDFEGGWVDRNVMGWDELMAGGKHPYFWGNGTIGNNVQFSGYEGWSLTGETMLIANASYRFPLARDLDFKMGPVYTEAVYLQFFGSAGNLWSYRIDGPSHTEGWSQVADNLDDIRREIPFQDYAYKNSPADHPNYLLEDAGVELRVKAFIWNDWDWDSFIRMAYGFQSTAGYGDVNGDLIQSSVARDAASELSDEIEPPTLRFYAGLGTGW